MEGRSHPGRIRPPLVLRLPEGDIGGILWAVAGKPGFGKPPRQRSRLLSFPLVVLLALAGGLLWARESIQESAQEWLREPLARFDAIKDQVAANARPPLPSDAASKRLVPAPPKPGGSGGYAFMTSTAKGPAAYDPCRPLHIVVNKEKAPKGADKLLKDAIAQVGPAAGLKIIVEGETDELTRESRAPKDPTRYGNRWSPVLVAWTTPTRDTRLASAVGIGGSVTLEDKAGRPWNVSGMVNLDGADFTKILARPSGRKQAVAVIAHELGHVVGLAHPDAEGQLMTVNDTGMMTVDGPGRLTWGKGDRRGLAQLADVPCNREF